MSRIANPCISVFATLVALMGIATDVCAQSTVRIPVETAQIRLIKEIPLSPEVNGTLVFLAAPEEGHVVKAGDVVFKLNDSLIQDQLILARDKITETEIDFANIALENARIELKVIQDANTRTPNSPAYTEAEVRQAELEVRKAEAQLKKANEEKHTLENEARIKETELKQYTVNSEMDGVVTQIHRYPGQNVRPGDPVVTVTDLTMLRAELLVNYRYHEAISIGDEVEIFIATTESGAGPIVNPEAPQPAPRGKGLLNDAPGFQSGVRRPQTPVDTPQITSALPKPAPSAGSPQGEKFIGQVSLILPKLDDNRRIRVWVNVPNRQDAKGRFILKEKVEVSATILGH